MKALTYEEWRKRTQEPAPFVIYDRYSSDLQDTSTGVNRQNRCREFAQKNNIRIVDVFYDEALSGTSTENRKRYKALLAEAMTTTRRFVGIVIFSSSRWGRAEDSEIDFMILNGKGIRIMSATEPAFQAEGAHGDLMRGIIQKVNAFFSKQTGITTHAMMTGNCEEGYLNGGKAPDGYVSRPVSLGLKNTRGEERFRYRLDLDEKPGPQDSTSEPRWRWVRLAVDMHLKQAKGLRTIANELHVLGFRGPKKGRHLNPSNIRSAFKNARYTGFLVWNVRKWKKASGKRRWTENPIEEWVWSREATHPAIFTREEFQTLWTRFEARKHSKTSVRRQLLAGLLKCGACGSGFVINSKKKNGKAFAYLVCGNKTRHGWASCPTRPIVMDMAEEVIEEAVLKAITDPDSLRSLFEAVNEWTSAEGDRIDETRRTAEKERTKLQGEIENFTRAIAAAGAQAASLVAEIARREKRLEQLSVAAVPGGDPGALTWKDKELVLWAERFRGFYFGVGMELRRAVLTHVIREIVVDKDKSGRIVIDPTALLTLREAWPDFPAELPVRIPDRCGGWI